ncbi:HAD-IG family 5'-nucleotidase [Geothrix sp. PMB-07]|uniref:HAD-IG family 5'-nucleotidase n=1 Tax=Geothrix sp. PMB-07 TaxID=3068640 RepID=UPI002741ABA2|nr:HAD-IG family 5'-nucleotidase [Geothrix sp. PMB-07]WLT32519.1 HAD-IG family 5'-nucleotidase [Geothrix sp. PMB-07]
MLNPELPEVPRGRGIFCNRTLNMRSVKAIGYDMDYTLVDYRVDAFERMVYAQAQQRLASEGWPTEGLEFDARMVTRGLVIDTELGNLVKANRFGFVKRAMHGTRMLEFAEQREAYAQTLVDLSDPRWVFLNTLFSLSEGCLFAQAVDLLDRGALPRPFEYASLYRHVRARVDAQHLEGHLKAEIAAAPDRYVVQDPEAAQALLDQKNAGKKLLLITNSEWSFTSKMMAHAYDRHLPEGMTWRQLFDLVIVSARKPAFFTERGPFFEVVDESGLLRPLVGPLHLGGMYLGGSAAQVERDLGVSGDEILYVGDHMFGDVHVSKRTLSWRTALVLRELEGEVLALEGYRPIEVQLMALMREKETLEARLSRARLVLQRLRGTQPKPTRADESEAETRVHELRNRLLALDAEIAPLAKAGTELTNARWGLLTRAGNDKSHLTRQIERYADIYTSRVSNFLHATPYAYFRSPRGNLPHDPAGNKE